jgi:hypothetical protein
MESDACKTKNIILHDQPISISEVVITRLNLEQSHQVVAEELDKGSKHGDSGSYTYPSQPRGYYLQKQTKPVDNAHHFYFN